MFFIDNVHVILRYSFSHLNRKCSYDYPRKCDILSTSTHRKVVIKKDPNIGFGFVIGSENPVIVRFITIDGPSYQKLHYDDQILTVNGVDVQQAPREKVIGLIRSSDIVELIVSQPNDDKKSTLLSPSKKTKYKTKLNKVRFAQSIIVEVKSLTQT